MLIRSGLFFTLLLLSFGSRAEQDIYIERNGEKNTFFILEKGLKKTDERKNIKTPLGSIWKLLVYAYIRENNLNYSPYQCQGHFNEEVFCCKKGQSVGIDQALKNSCGLYFSPYRLKISEKNWRRFWRKQGLTFDWLADLRQVKPKTQILVNELLSSLEVVRDLPKAKNHLDKTLLDVVLSGTAHKSLPELGSLARFKTYTWDGPTAKKSFVGGIAGWRKDGVVFWANGKGRSSDFLERTANTLGKHWAEKIIKQPKQCVTVRYFHDYPILKIVDLSNGRSINAGSLQGNYEISFKTGRTIRVDSNDKLIVRSKGDRLFVDGKFGVDEYVARVIDREISPRFESAAEAFSIVMRSYLFERAKAIGGCLHVIDSSKFQRVSANIPSSSAVRIVNKTSNLILKNVSNVTYHLDKDGKNKISWLKAKGLDLVGENFQEILSSFYPNVEIGQNDNKYSKSCREIKLANKWLGSRSKLWHRQLVRRPGYERPDKFKVCILNHGAPFTNKTTHEIFVRGFEGIENQYSIAHEYLHLAFKFHPIGNNETEIDKIAKKLVRTF